MFVSPRVLVTSLSVILALLFSACSHVAVPRSPIPVKMEIVGAMVIDKEVSFENGVTESKLNLVGTDGADKWYADYKVWSSFIVSQLENELRSRGVPIRPESQNAFKVRVESVAVYFGFATSRCILLARVEKKDGTWSKAYEANNSSGKGHWYRAVDGAVYRVVVAIP